MAVEAERLLVTVSAQGADSADREIRGVGRSAVQSSAGVDALGDALDSTGRDAIVLAGNMQVLQGRLDEVGDEFSETDRSASGASRSLSGFVGAALSALGPITTLNGRLDETSDELNQVRNSAMGASGAMGAYQGATLSAALATYTIHDALIAGAIPSLIVLLSTLGPIVGTVGALTAGLLGLATGFGAVLGTGALAWFQQTEDAMQRLVDLRDELLSIAAAFGEQFVPLIDAAINALPELARRIVAATGDMQPFVDELYRLGSAAMDVLPRVIGWFMDIGREAIPVWRDFTDWVGRRTPDALRFFRSVVSRTWDPLHSLTVALMDALATFTRFGVVAVNVVGPMLESVLGGFESLLEYVMDLPPGIRDVVVAMGALAPVFTIAAVAGAEVLRIMRGMITTFTTSNTLIARMTPTFGAMATALGLVAGAAIALSKAYKTNFAGIADATDRVASVLKEEFLLTMQVARETIIPILRDIKNAFLTFAGDSEGAVGSLVDLIADGLVVGIRTAGRAIRAVLRGLRPAFQMVSSFINDTLVPALQSVADTTRPLIERFVTVDNAVKVLAATVGTLAAAAVGLFNPFTAIAVLLKGAVATAFSGVILAIGGLLGAVGTLVSALAGLTLQGIAGSVITAIKLVGTTVIGLTGPIAIAIGLAAALYGAWKTNFFGIRDLTYRVLDGIKRTLRGDMSAAQNTVDIVSAKMRSLWENRLLPMWQTTKRVFNQIKTVVTNVMNWIWKHAIAPALAGIEDLYATHGEHLAKEIRETYEAIKGYITSVINFLMPYIRKTTGTMMAIWDRWGDEIMTIVEFAMDTIGHVIKIAVDAILTTISIALNIIQGDWEGVWSDISGFFSRTLGEIIDFAKDWGGRLIGYFSDLGSRAYDAGKGLINEFADGIKNAAGEATDAVDDVVDDVSSYLPGSNAETGPLDHITEQGAGLPEAVATGMEKNVRVVGKAAETVARYARPELAADSVGPIPASGDGGNTYNIKVDARGSDNPAKTRRESKNGLAAALEAENVRS